MSCFGFFLSFLMGALLIDAGPTIDASLGTILDADNFTTYNIVDGLVFNLKVNESYSVNVTGTIQDAFAVLREVDPAQADDLENSIRTRAAQPTNMTSVAPSGLVGDDDCCDRLNYYCDLWEDANCGRIEEGISYLKGLNGFPTIGPIPNSCSRVSCSYNSAIFWCNNNTYAYQLDNYSLIADGAQQIMNDCTFSQSGNVCGGGFNGQQSYSGNWSVLVMKADC